MVMDDYFLTNMYVVAGKKNLLTNMYIGVGHGSYIRTSKLLLLTMDKIYVVHLFMKISASILSFKLIFRKQTSLQKRGLS